MAGDELAVPPGDRRARRPLQREVAGSGRRRVTVRQHLGPRDEHDQDDLVPGHTHRRHRCLVVLEGCGQGGEHGVVLVVQERLPVCVDPFLGEALLLSRLSPQQRLLLLCLGLGPSPRGGSGGQPPPGHARALHPASLGDEGGRRGHRGQRRLGTYGVSERVPVEVADRRERLGDQRGLVVLLRAGDLGGRGTGRVRSATDGTPPPLRERLVDRERTEARGESGAAAAHVEPRRAGAHMGAQPATADRDPYPRSQPGAEEVAHLRPRVRAGLLPFESWVPRPSVFLPCLPIVRFAVPCVPRIGESPVTGWGPTRAPSSPTPATRCR